MKTLKYFWLILALGMLAACSEENIFPSEQIFNKNDNTVISIMSVDMTPINITRANSSDLDKIMSKVKDLNIRIHKKNGTYTSLYCQKNGIRQDGLITKESYYVPQHSLNEFNDPLSIIKVHSNCKATEVESVEVIANAEKDLHETKDWKNVNEIGDSYLTAADGPFCMMYGKSNTASKTYHNDLNNQRVDCQNYSIELKRTRAMITVKMAIDAKKGLKSGITITPKKIRLCNVPTKCNLQKLRPDFLGASGKNAIGEDINESIAKVQEIDLIQPDGTYLNLSQNGLSPTGEHIKTDGVIPSKFIPFYMFENMQGKKNPENKDHTKKNPGQFTIEQLKDRTNIFKYSYIEIEADYEQADKNVIKVSGNIIYRFFLGQDATSDFNIEGNHYYKLSLNISGFGGAVEDGKVDDNGNLVVNKKDLSWRVDMNTKDFGLVKDEYDFDSHLYRGFAKVVGENWRFLKVLVNGKEDSGGASWLTLSIKKDQGSNDTWANPTQLTGQNAKLNITYGSVEFLVQPMIYGRNGKVDPDGYYDETTYQQKKCYREMQLIVAQVDANNKDTGLVDTVTVRQYCPIPISNGKETVFMERFEEYNPKFIGWPWKYQNDPLNNLKWMRSSQETWDDTPGNRKMLEGYLEPATYNWGRTLTKEAIGLNNKYLSPHVQSMQVGGFNTVRYPVIIGSDKGKDGAADVCFRKSLTGYTSNAPQGSPATYYALPDQSFMQAMIDFDPKKSGLQGPFEPIHILEDYWTCSVDKSNTKETIFYDGNSGTFIQTNSTSKNPKLQRTTNKRVRSIFTNQYGHGEQ